MKLGYHTQKKFDAAYDRFIAVVEQIADEKTTARLATSLDYRKTQDQLNEAWKQMKTADDAAGNYRFLLEQVLDDDNTSLRQELIDQIRAAVNVAQAGIST